jgi:hypothetical protein
MKAGATLHPSHGQRRIEPQHSLYQEENPGGLPGMGVAPNRMTEHEPADDKKETHGGVTVKDAK